LKTKLNRSIEVFKNLLDLERNQRIQEYLSKLTATAAINYSLWKTTKKLIADTIAIYQEAGWKLVQN
jgi:flavoprotein